MNGYRVCPTVLIKIKADKHKFKYTVKPALKDTSI